MTHSTAKTIQRPPQLDQHVNANMNLSLNQPGFHTSLESCILHPGAGTASSAAESAAAVAAGGFTSPKAAKTHVPSPLTIPAKTNHKP